MKKFIPIMLIMVLIFCTTGCGNKGTVTSASDSSQSLTEQPETEAEISAETPGTEPMVQIEHNSVETEEQVYDLKIGDKVKTENYEFNVEKIETTYQLDPDTKTSYYTYYAADNGYVYVHVDLTVKNLQKKDMVCDEIYSVTVDYNDGYTYDGFNVADDTDGDLTYANITNIAPLEKRGVHALVECPKEVETSQKPLLVNITFFDGTQYRYKLR